MDSKNFDEIEKREAPSAESDLHAVTGYEGDTGWTQAEERKLRRRVDWKLMPILAITFALQYYDKAMLGQAALFGLIKDLELGVNSRFSWSSSVFYVGFLLGSYPSMALAQRFPLERVASGLVTVWGVCLILTAVCTTWQGLIVERFFLGFLEAGISPMFMVITGSFYTKKEQAFRMGAWYSCVGLASIFSPLINYGFGLIGGGVSSWHYMYYFAGSITILWGLLLILVLPSDPARARGFDKRERYILVARLRTNNSGVRNTQIKLDQVKELLLDFKFWLQFFMALLSMIANAVLSTFSTIIISTLMGFSGLHALLLTMPSGVVAITFVLTSSWAAMRFRDARSYIYVGLQMITVLSNLLLWLLPTSAVGGLLFAMYILPGFSAGYSILMGHQIANTAGYTKRTLAASGLYIGYCIGNFVGPLTFRTQDAPNYQLGFIVVIVSSIISAVLGLVYRFVCLRDNQKRDKSGIMEGFDDAFNDDQTDKRNPQFRYVL